MGRDFKMGDQVRITGNGSGNLHHGLKVGGVGEVVNDTGPDTFRVQGESKGGGTLGQWVNRRDLEHARTSEEIRREFLELIGAEDG